MGVDVSAAVATRVTHAAYEAGRWGVGELWLVGGRLVECEHPRAREPGSSTRHPLGERLREWFAGAEDDFLDVELELDGCTPFQRAAIEALRRVPRGEVVTYGELAALAGRPGAARAAGSVCATNRFAVVVPCHRVVSASGLGGYGGLGAAYKRRLLELEGVAV
jgi:methylated-DNA-[protein]-cysteine S-methyltransferase